MQRKCVSRVSPKALLVGSDRDFHREPRRFEVFTCSEIVLLSGSAIEGSGIERAHEQTNCEKEVLHHRINFIALSNLTTRVERIRLVEGA